MLSRPPAPTDTLRVAPKAFWKVGCLLLALPSSSRQEEQTFPIAAFVSNRSTAVRQQQNTKNKIQMISSTLQLVVSFIVFAFILLLFACCVSIALPSCCTAPALCPRRVSCYFYFLSFFLESYLLIKYP